MNYDLSKYITSNLAESVDSIFRAYGLNVCNEHVKRVTDYIVKVADKFNVDKKKAMTASLLHDIGGIVPRHERIEYCDINCISLCEEERILPLIIHQKISRHLAITQFGIIDEEILSAIACHTTMKKDASQLDMLLFISDKIEWDQCG